MDPHEQRAFFEQQGYLIVPDLLNSHEYSSPLSGASPCTVVALMSEAMATGPVDKCREEPKSAATAGGRKAAYSP